MARLIAMLMPDCKSTVVVSQIARATAYANGTGIFDVRDKMIGWVACKTLEDAMYYVQEINDIINDPGRAKQPEWFTVAAPDAE